MTQQQSFIKENAMETPDPNTDNNMNMNTKKSVTFGTDTRDSESHNMTELDSPHSPLRVNSPLRSDQPDPPPSEKPTSKAIVVVDKYSHGGGGGGIGYSPFRPPPLQEQQKQDNTPENMNVATAKSPSLSPVVVFNRAVREEMSSVVTKVDPSGEDGVGFDRERRPRAVTTILRRSKREVMVKRAALGFRVCEMLLCLISFSIMAADKTQGWSGDSFDRYTEYRYCLSVTVIAFAYSGFQAYDITYHLITGKHIISHHLRYHFDFSMDQILAYLLISASSSAATRVDDWQSNWGKDRFTEMASASVGMSFMAFAAFAFSSLISGYNLCTRNFT